MRDGRDGSPTTLEQSMGSACLEKIQTSLIGQV